MSHARGPAVLNVSLDAQIAAGAAGQAGAVFGDPAERQRRYAAYLDTLHVVVKTGRAVRQARLPLAANAWAYPTRSRSRYFFVPDAVRLAGGICRRSGVDVVSAQDPFATGLASYLVARRFGRPLNVQVHFDVLDNPYWLAEKAEHRLLNALGKWLVRRATTVRVGTSRERRQFAAWGLDPQRIFVAPVPVDLDRFAGAVPDPPLLAWASGGPLILAAKRLVPQKDVPTLLRAMAEVVGQRPDARLAIAGDGPLRPGLEGLAAALGLSARVRFLGRIDGAAMPPLMAAAAALAVSSAYEGTTLVAVEAAAAGKPVVTTDVAGAADTVVDGVTGRVVPLGDHHALAAALLDVLASPARARQMGAAGQAHVRERFGHERAVRQVIDMWRATADWGHA